MKRPAAEVLAPPWELAELPSTISAAERFAVGIARLRRWEFWPAWAFYPPVVAYIVWLGMLYRRPTAFTAANPGLEAGGFVGERKSECLLPLMKRAPELVAPLHLLPASEPLRQRQRAAERFVVAHGGYPVVLKPDIGQRGRGVAVIRGVDALHSYLAHAPGDVLIQRYVAGAEFGVFVYREPLTGAARVFSVTHKQFPQLVGDGRSTLQSLIRQHPRARLIAPLLWRRFAARLDWVPAPGEVVPLIEIGAHCRGALFCDASDQVSPQLLDFVARLFRALPGYHFGRIDLRCPSVEALSRGEGLRVLEINGVSSEAAHIYQPGTPLLAGYSSMLRQWRLAFEIGDANARRGTPTCSPMELLSRALDDRRRARQWF